MDGALDYQELDFSLLLSSLQHRNHTIFKETNVSSSDVP